MSWGYHGDDGYAFIGNLSGLSYGQLFSEGDVVGCGVDLKERTAFFTKNGESLGSLSCTDLLLP